MEIKQWEAGGSEREKVTQLHRRFLNRDCRQTRGTLYKHRSRLSRSGRTRDAACLTLPGDADEAPSPCQDGTCFLEQGRHSESAPPGGEAS